MDPALQLALAGLPRPFQTRLHEALDGPESALWRDAGFTRRFALVWDLLVPYEQSRLKFQGWSLDALAGLERTCLNHSPALTAEALGGILVSVDAGHFGSSDYENVLAWLYVRGYSPHPPEIERMVGWAVPLGEWAPYTFAAGLSLREARAGIDAGTLNKDELRVLAALHGIPLP